MCLWLVGIDIDPASSACDLSWSVLLSSWARLPTPRGPAVKCCSRTFRLVPKTRKSDLLPAMGRAIGVFGRSGALYQLVTVSER